MRRFHSPIAMLRLLPLLLAPVLAARPCPAQERESAAVRLDAVARDEATPRPLFPRFALAFEPGADGGPRTAHVSFAGARHRLVFARPEGTFALGLVTTPDGREVRGRARAAGERGFAVLFDEVPLGAVAGRVALVYRGTELAEAWFAPDGIRRGRVLLGGAAREVLLVDADADGAYDGPADRWLALRADRARGIPTLRRPETMLLSEPQIPFEADGRAFQLEEVAADGSRCVLVLAPPGPGTGVEDVLERRYAEVRAEYRERFEREADAFRREHGIDPGRPRVDEPARWRRMTLSEAKRRAREAGKPLLVHYFAETNPWSYRYGYYTFPDAEVDALLRRFYLVRIDAPKDPERSYEETGARGLPTLLPLTPDGERVEFRLRTRDHGTGEVTELARPERTIPGWQRPTELAENLRRILAAIHP